MTSLYHGASHQFDRLAVSSVSQIDHQSSFHYVHLGQTLAEPPARRPDEVGTQELT